MLDNLYANGSQPTLRADAPFSLHAVQPALIRSMLQLETATLLSSEGTYAPSELNKWGRQGRDGIAMRRFVVRNARLKASKKTPATPRISNPVS